MNRFFVAVLVVVAMSSVSEGGIIFRNRNQMIVTSSEVMVARSRVVEGSTIRGRCTMVNGRMTCR